MSLFSSKSMPQRALRALVPVALAATTHAHAATELCIESSSALYQAFADIDGGSTDDITLKLRSGTYTLGSDLLLDYRGNGGDPQANYGRLTIRGGYGPGCTSQSAALGATTLNGSGGQRVLGIEMINNALVIDRISSTNVDWEFGNWICYQAQDRPATITGLRALNSRVSFTFMGCYDILIQNSMVTARADSAGDIAVGYLSYFATSSHPATFALTNSTLRGGSLSLDFLPFDDDEHPASATVELFGNVFENDGTEVLVDGGDLYSSHNRYDSLTLAHGVLATNLDNISAAPLLQSSGVPQNNSPVVNAGTRFVPGGLPQLDLAGNPRLVGSDPDMGAFETPVDNSLYLDVTTTAATGAGSLAQAVASANGTNGRQVIRFDIAGSCPRTIQLSQALTLTDDTDILGETQPGSQPNTFALGYNGEPCVILKAGAGVGSAFVFDSNESADNLKLSQLAFSGFTGTAVDLRSGRGHLVTGNQFGGSVGDTALLDVATAIRVGDGAADVQIGGPDHAQTNFIGGASLGIILDGNGDNSVIGNALGDAGLQNAPNAAALVVYSDHNLVQDNWISRSTAINILMTGADAHDNTFRDNLVIRADGAGMLIDGGAHDNRVGPDNSFASNGGDGIFVHSGSPNDLSGNQYSNNDGLAIDLGDDGVTPNDPDPAIDGVTTPNRNQNFPVLTRAQPSPDFAFFVLDGTLSSTLGTYRIDLYRNHACNASGHGEGLILLGSNTVDLDCTFVPPNGQCTKAFTLLVPGIVVPGDDQITATVTSPYGHTSEFSACRAVTTNDVIFADGFDD
ncbi:MAG TPA: right-handed parallel beta-helix repeat-containing protein [Dokdonella sp.]|nr:right-handed parallel beta-helix repeat-containing protein [Dokdonella sp.]